MLYVGVPGIAVAVASLIVWAVHDHREVMRREREAAHEVEDMQRAARILAVAREQAWLRIKAAYIAARDEDCALVRELGETVRALDRELHARVFARDVAVKRCYATAP